MLQVHTKTTLMSPEVYRELRAAREGDEMADKEACQSGFGSLLHLAQGTHPDIALAVGALATYSSAPGVANFAAVLDVIRFVGSTADCGITYGCSRSPVRVWCNSNSAAYLNTRRKRAR
jgi:hypothetical protein